MTFFRAPAPWPGVLFLLALACFFSVASLRAGAETPAQLDPYQQYVSAKLAEFEKKYPIPSPACPPDLLHVQADMAATEVRVWTWTADKAVLADAQARLTAILAAPKAGRDFFFGIYPLTFCVEVLSPAGQMDATMRADIGAFLAKNAAPSEGNELHNRSLLRACGFANAAKLWPDSPAVPVWKRYAAHIESMLLGLEDVDENAPNYNRLDMFCVFLLHDILGHPEVLQKPGLRAMYLRYRDQIAPSGAIPSYGDSGRLEEDENNPFGFDNGMIPADFERAAVVYHDPTFRWAALQNFALIKRPGQINDPGELFPLSFASGWADLTMKPVAPVLTSQILQRLDAPAHTAPDKLILRSSAGSQVSSYLELDLFGRGAHAHDNQRGAITYVEENRLPLVTALGYDNRQPEHANLFLMSAAQSSFPFFEIQANTWQHLLTPPVSLSDGGPMKMTLRVAGHERGVTLWISQAGLQRDGVTQPMDALLDPQNWKGRVKAEIGQEDGRPALSWQFPPGASTVDFISPDPAFSQPGQPRVDFQWKLSNVDETVRPLIVRFPNDFDFNASLRVLNPTLADESVEDRGSAHYGSATYDHWFTEDTRLEQQMVLLDDGTLVVLDTLTPGPQAVGMEAGPVWNPASRFVKALPSGGFLLGPPGNEHALFLDAEQPMNADSKTLDVWHGKNHTTVYGMTVLKNQSLRAVSVFLPAGDSTKPAVTYGPDAVVISLSNHRVVSLGSSNKWQLSGGS